MTRDVTSEGRAWYPIGPGASTLALVVAVSTETVELYDE